MLFLDELPEFAPSVLQGIRQPMEAGEVVVTRTDGSVRFPARFMLVAAANPCPCGFFGDSECTCTCSQRQVHQYQGRVGGPSMDRIDVHIDVARIPPGQVLSTGTGPRRRSFAKVCLRLENTHRGDAAPRVLMSARVRPRCWSSRVR